jgi:hypothetical protein
VLDLSGVVTYRGAPLADAPVIFSRNGRDSFHRTDEQGRFDSALALIRGLNRVSLRATGPNGQTYFSPTYEITLGSPDITINLEWNTEETDLDLHVFDPNGAHAWYGDLSGIPNGMIDRDDTDGSGPETFTLTSPPPGTYRANVDAYAIYVTDTEAHLTVMLGNAVIFDEEYDFTADDYNAGGGVGSDSDSFWEAIEFTIGEIGITQISFVEDSGPAEAIFTTAENEREITVRALAPETIPEDQLALNVVETNEMFEVDTADSTFSNGAARFDADHEPPEDLTARSGALTYDVAVRAAMQGIESSPKTIMQEVRSQIRQEYVDKAEGVAGFDLPTPGREAIIDEDGFPGAAYFTFRELAQFSDYMPDFAIIEESVVIADAVRAAWGYPLVVSSGYRNPRRNDRVGGVINSRHQLGDAVDLNPPHDPNMWPTEVPCNGTPQALRGSATVRQARAALA